MPNRTGRGTALGGAAALAAILAVFLLVRLPLLTPEASARGWNGDASIFGLMAKKIHDGRGFDVFYWGQNYMGPLTSALAAAIRRVALDPPGVGAEGGPIALRLASMCEIAFGISFFVGGLARIFGRAVAAATGLWLALGPAHFVRLSAAERPGPEMSFALGSILFFLAAGALSEADPFLDRTAGLFTFGFVTGLGWWMNQTVVFVVLPVAGLVAARFGRSPARRVLPVLAGAALGYLPVWMGRLLSWYEPAPGPVLPPWRLADAPARLVRFVATDFWRLTGLEGLGPAPVLVAGGAVLLALLVAAARRRPAPDPPGLPSRAGLALVFAIAGLGAAALVLRDVDPTQLRYVAPALPATLALLVFSVAEGARRIAGRIPPAVVAVALVAAGAGTALFLAREARAAVESVLRGGDPRSPLKGIYDKGYSVCHAGYDTAYTLQFLSDERVRFVPYHSFDRNRALSARLRAEPGTQCLVTDDGSVRDWLPSDAAQEGGPASRRVGKL